MILAVHHSQQHSVHNTHYMHSQLCGISWSWTHAKTKLIKLLVDKCMTDIHLSSQTYKLIYVSKQIFLFFPPFSQL